MQEAMHQRPLIGIPTQTLHAIDGIPEHLPESWVMSQRYYHTIASQGAVPWMIPLLDRDLSTLRDIYARLDGLFLAGGVDLHPASYGQELHPLTGRTDPPRDRVELRLTGWALEEGKPVFGACRGMQALNVAGGGTLYQDVHEQRTNTIKHDYYPIQGYPRDYLAHEVELAERSRLRHIYGADRVRVNSMHHQGVGDLAPGMVVSGRASDGLVEAIEAADGRYAVGVQWHPEMLARTDEATRRLFASFLDAAAAYRRGRLVPGYPTAAAPARGDRTRPPGPRLL